MEDGYKGYKEVILNNEEMAAFYSAGLKTNPFNLLENEYLFIKDKDEKIVDRFCYRHGELQPLKYKVIDNPYSGPLKPKNKEQQCAFDLFDNREVPLKLLRGVYGSGLII